MSNEKTWDGKPVSPKPPFGASVIVYRQAAQEVEYLILHRAHDVPESRVTGRGRHPQVHAYPARMFGTAQFANS